MKCLINKKKKTVVTFFLSLLCVFTLICPMVNRANAATPTTFNIIYSGLRRLQLGAGEVFHFATDIKLYSRYATTADVTVDPGNAPITIENLRFSGSKSGAYIVLSTEISQSLEFDIIVDEYAKIGNYTYTIHLEGMDDDYEPISLSCEMSLKIMTELQPPTLVITSGLEYAGRAGEDVTLNLKFENFGEINAMNTYVTIDYDPDIMMPTYMPLTRRIGQVNVEDTFETFVSYRIDDDAPTKRVKLPVRCSFKDLKGEQHEEVSYIYFNVLPKTTRSGDLTITNIRQNPEEPVAGEPLTVTFNVYNNSATDISNLFFDVKDYVSGEFEPISANTLVEAGDLKSCEGKDVSITMKLGRNIGEGFTTLSVRYGFINGFGQQKIGGHSFYLLNIKSGLGASRPKLMINEFSSDSEIQAGSPFTFNFKILNTNDQINAKNIKITVTSNQGAFSVTEGGNSFFINEIAPGEAKELNVNLKAGSGLTTGAYPLNVLMEYEYDGMKSDTNGEKVEEELLLHVKETLRPAVENIEIAPWPTPLVNSRATLCFEFFNRGRSTLNNTYAVISGDFKLANGGNSYYIGNISEGQPEYVEIDVIPLVAGDAMGSITIFMEDSDGAEFSYEYSFFGSIGTEDGGMPMPGGLIGGFTPGYDDSYEMPYDDNEGGGIHWWGVLLIVVGALAVVTGGCYYWFVIYKKKDWFIFRKKKEGNGLQ